MKNSSIPYGKIWKLFLIALITFLMLFSTVTQSSRIPRNTDVIKMYNFESPTIETVDIAGNLYNRVTLPDCVPAGSAGEPKLPSKGVFLLLPPKSTISKIDITLGEQTVVQLEGLVEPTSQAIPLSQTENIPIPVPKETIYQSNTNYPGTPYTQVGIYNFRGYQILVLLLHPVQYNPVTGDLTSYKSIEVSVKTTETGIQSELYRGFDRDRNEVNQKVDNPEMSLQYSEECSPSPSLRDQYDLLIITTDALKSGFEPLKQAHDASGVNTVIQTLTDIGASDLESIRNFIKDAYTNWGIDYVLIGGDANVIPDPTLWVSGMDEGTTYYEDTMPADLYYACLDGPYNYDGDSKWGEPHDGEDGGDVDLIAEVYVGRACVDNIADVDRFVTKTVTYITKDPENPYLSKVLLLGEYIGDVGIASYSGTYLDQLVDNCSDDGYTTVGIPSTDYEITKLYDSPSYDWNPSELMAIINNGVHMIHHLGHSSYDYNMKMDSSDVSYLTNDDLCFIYSQGCMAGGFDDPYGYDCIAEDFTVKTDHAAFAGIWNARYGFFWSYSTDGDSQRLHREFCDAVFGESITEIGRANHDSKEDNLPIIGRSCIRWVYYETNLFGDPSLKFIDDANHPPEKPQTPSGPLSGVTGVNYLFSSVSTDPDSGDQLYYQWDWGDNVSGWFGPYASGLSVETTHMWMTAGDYQVKVKAKDSNELESEWSDATTIQVSKPAIEIGSISGGLKIKAEIKNTGSVNFTDINWTIVVKGGLVLVGKSSTGSIPTLLPGASSTITTGFAVGLGQISITVTAADVEKTATAFLFGPFILNVR
jgi:hypothetical protein